MELCRASCGCHAGSAGDQPQILQRCTEKGIKAWIHHLRSCSAAWECLVPSQPSQGQKSLWFVAMRLILMAEQRRVSMCPCFGSGPVAALGTAGDGTVLSPAVPQL